MHLRLSGARNGNQPDRRDPHTWRARAVRPLYENEANLRSIVYINTGEFRHNEEQLPSLTSTGVDEFTAVSVPEREELQVQASNATLSLDTELGVNPSDVSEEHASAASEEQYSTRAVINFSITSKGTGLHDLNQNYGRIRGKEHDRNFQRTSLNTIHRAAELGVNKCSSSGNMDNSDKSSLTSSSSGWSEDQISISSSLEVLPSMKSWFSLGCSKNYFKENMYQFYRIIEWLNQQEDLQGL